jgi:NhaA family Na+:H+ antiporter
MARRGMPYHRSTIVTGGTMTASSRASERKGLVGYFEWFVRSEVAGSVLLLACTVAALTIANSPWAAAYDRLLHTAIGLSWGGVAYTLDLHHWINDGLMVVFFFVVGLEVKRELVVGELSSLEKASLPVAAALGGMIVPAGLFLMLNAGGDGARGWGIPMTTDIAFALGVLAIFGRRAPIGLKVFLTALAIADDMGAVVVIALFYTETIDVASLLAAAVLLAALVGAIRVRLRFGLQLLLMIGVWLAVFASGVHATVAGILLAMVIPVRPRVGTDRFIVEAEAVLDRVRQRQQSGTCVVTDSEQLEALEFVHTRAGDTLPTGLMLEHALHPVQVWLILPLFALANAGLTIGGDAGAVVLSPVALGIIAGLALGKPVGITLASWLVVRLGRGGLPDGVTWPQIVGAGCLAGIGFTMSLFITELAFADPTLVVAAKIGILVASLTSGVLGLVLLGRALPRASG